MNIRNFAKTIYNGNSLNKLFDFCNNYPSVIIKLKKLFFNIRFVKFFIAGIVNVINGTLLGWLFSSFILQSNIAFILGYIISLCISYLLNTFFVFSQKNVSFNKFFKFCISYFPNFLVQNIIVYIISVFDVSKLVIYAVSGIISFPLTYILLCFFTFKKNISK